MIIRTVQAKTRIESEGNIPFKDIKLEINLEDLQEFYTKNNYDDAVIAKMIGETVMKSITLNKKAKIL